MNTANFSQNRRCSGHRLRSLAAIVTSVMIPVWGCAARTTPYDRLCKIYEEFGSEPSTPETAYKISQRVEKEIPEIYSNYDLIVVGGIDRRYEAFKEFARETANQPNWSCEAIRKRYPPAAAQ
jgi:hypothetical protein